MAPIPSRPRQTKPTAPLDADPDQIQRAVEGLQHLTGVANLMTEFADLPNLNFPPQAYNIYLHNILDAAGNPTDPIHRMMIEQFVAANLKIGRLNRLSAAANTPEVARVYDASSATLLSEFRRMGLSIKTYREPASQSHVTVVKQQNLAHNQQVAYVDAPPATVETVVPPPEKKGHDTQLTSKALEHVPSTPAFTESAPSRSREAQPASPARPPRRITRETPSDGVNAPTVAPLNRSTDPSR